MTWRSAPSPSGGVASHVASHIAHHVAPHVAGRRGDVRRRRPSARAPAVADPRGAGRNRPWRAPRFIDVPSTLGRRPGRRPGDPGPTFGAQPPGIRRRTPRGGSMSCALSAQEPKNPRTRESRNPENRKTGIPVFRFSNPTEYQSVSASYVVNER